MSSASSSFWKPTLTGRKPQKKGQEERVKEGIHFFFLSFFSKFQSAGFVDGMSGPGRICLLIEQTTWHSKFSSISYLFIPFLCVLCVGHFSGLKYLNAAFPAAPKVSTHEQVPKILFSQSMTSQKRENENLASVTIGNPRTQSAESK